MKTVLKVVAFCALCLAAAVIGSVMTPAHAGESAVVGDGQWR